MLSADQFLRLISMPAAFLIASQIPGGALSRPVPIQMASE
jgi:hypothetical protein